MPESELLYNILMSDVPSVEVMKNKEIIFELFPEFETCYGFNQHNDYHIYDVFNHTLVALDNTKKDYYLRVATFFHDVGKPVSFVTDEYGVGHFYGHWEESLKIFDKYATYFFVSAKDIELIKDIIYYHDLGINDESMEIFNEVFGEDIHYLYDIKKADILAQNLKYCDRLEELNKYSKNISKLDFYKYLLNVDNIPEFLKKYLNCPSIQRLKNIGYFCGMDYASKDVYNFSEYISRYDHSVTTAMTVFNHTSNRLDTLRALVHDVGTPCFSHVIDYMNHDYVEQESTEEYLENILASDEEFIRCLKEDGISFKDVVNFKESTVVDIKRPGLCADRIDGIVLNGIAWAKNISYFDIFNIVNDTILYKNEKDDFELGISNIKTNKRVLEINDQIDLLCHSKEDNYMMKLLADITEYAILRNYISYELLYVADEIEILELFGEYDDDYLKDKLRDFYNIKKENIESTYMPEMKIRTLKPIVNGYRVI